MTPEDKGLIKMLLDCHYSSYDFSYEDYETFRGRQVGNSMPKIYPGLNFMFSKNCLNTAGLLFYIEIKDASGLSGHYVCHYFPFKLGKYVYDANFLCMAGR